MSWQEKGKEFLSRPAFARIAHAKGAKGILFIYL